MVNKYCQKFQHPEYSTRTLQTDGLATAKT